MIYFQATAPLFVVDKDQLFVPPKSKVANMKGSIRVKKSKVINSISGEKEVLQFADQAEKRMKVLPGLCVGAPICPTFLPHFRLYGVVSLHMCVLPYKYRKILKMLLKLMKLCAITRSRKKTRN